MKMRIKYSRKAAFKNRYKIDFQKSSRKKRRKYGQTSAHNNWIRKSLINVMNRSQSLLSASMRPALALLWKELDPWLLVCTAELMEYALVTLSGTSLTMW